MISLEAKLRIEQALDRHVAGEELISDVLIALCDKHKKLKEAERKLLGVLEDIAQGCGPPDVMAKYVIEEVQR